MFATTLIVFRESLEAALFVGIVAAATRGLYGRARWLGAGVGAGALGAMILALLAHSLSGWLEGLGQDVLNISVLSLALGMLLWHCIWVASHTRERAADAKQIGQYVQQGSRAPWALLVAVALAVLREGAETVLFVGGSLTGAGATSPASALVGGVLGLVAGAGFVVLAYAGLARVPARHIFSLTNLLIALLAASLASQLARTLAQAGLLDTWIGPLWDSTQLLAPDSALGTLLHALLGYDVRPSAAQWAAYVGVLLAIYVGTRLLRPKSATP